ncbi:MAG: glycosyltransferase [Bacteroidetes bacterium]|uniref:Glycosyltransferase n=1 Tax=Candidatus Cryptobacteroides gallistercoris TaxID=2840765 RepID=A0A940IH69_9BACT|nr:glycosyltransferase [Candidatus Cryptobacteroides gallistercoris]
MNNKPLISILVPCYNVEAYLRQCMDSIIRQTYTNLEIICLDDGSTDRTPEILKEYEKKDSRTRVISKPNSGYGATMNIGLKAASGKYIGIVESDDYIEPKMYEILCDAAEKDNLDIVRCRFIERNVIKSKDKVNTFSYVKDNGRVFRPTDVPSSFTMKPSIWAGMYNREFLERNGIRFLETPGASYQDTAFAFKALATAQRVRMLPDVLHNYRINEASSVSSPGKVFCVCDEEAEIRRYVNSLGRYEELKGIMALRAFGSYKWNYNRLGPMKLKRAFMKRWSEEARQMFADGAITRKNFSRNRIFRLRIIAYCPCLYHFIKKV